MDATTVPEELRCTYSQATCLNERTFKKSGERHTLCEYHREKNNAAQRKSSRVRRAEKRRSHTLEIAQKLAAESGIPLDQLINTEKFESDMREATHATYIESEEDYASDNNRDSDAFGEFDDSNLYVFNEEDIRILKQALGMDESY